LREAENGSKIVMEIKQKSGINLKIVDGKSEAELIYSNRSDKILKDFDTFLYIDVGGDSTELTFFSRDGRNKSLSFNLGTVRILENMVWRDDWKQMKIWIKENGMKYRPKIAIGSGGNINKIFRLTTQKLAKPLAYKKMRRIYNNLKSYPYQDRITKLGLRPDRANVIIPASRIYLSVMKWVKVNKILVPQVGLADGAVHVLYQNFKQRKRSQ
jgi:exopolyphosphatase/guanosine-5'-triphosphate,3'-diphosphate pyrophosphatase